MDFKLSVMFHVSATEIAINISLLCKQSISHVLSNVLIAERLDLFLNKMSCGQLFKMSKFGQN